MGQKARKDAAKKAKKPAAAKKADDASSKKKKGKKVTAAGAGAAAGSKKVKAGVKAAAKNGKKGNTMDVETKATKKLATTAGKGKAARAAQLAQKRGQSTTGKASVKDIKATIAKEALKLAKSMIAKSGGNKNIQVRGGNSKAMKISFRPSELGKSTNKNTAAQIGALLSKAPKGKKTQTLRQPGAERKVILR